MNKTIEIELAAVQVGMVLAQDVLNASGQTLAPAGAVISTSLLEGLRKRAIVRLTVSAQQDAVAEAAAQEARIAYLFRKAEDAPILAALRQALEQYRRGEGGAC